MSNVSNLDRVSTKRSVAVDGRRTSISLEPEFWDALAESATAEQRSINEHVTYIAQHHRNGSNLSSAIRVYLFRNATPRAT